MEIRIVDINDAEHPLKTGEMLIDRINNIMYVGGQFNINDINLLGVFNLVKITGVLKHRRKIEGNVTIDFTPNINVYGNLKHCRKISPISDININFTPNISISGTFGRE